MDDGLHLSVFMTSGVMQVETHSQCPPHLCEQRGLRPRHSGDALATVYIEVCVEHQHQYVSAIAFQWQHEREHRRQFLMGVHSAMSTHTLLGGRRANAIAYNQAQFWSLETSRPMPQRDRPQGSQAEDMRANFSMQWHTALDSCVNQLELAHALMLCIQSREH